MYAIVKTGGKQVKVEVGQAIYVEKLNAEAGDKVTFEEVVFVGGDDVKVGAPFVAGATVEGTNVVKTHTVNKVTVNLIQKLLLTQSTLNHDDSSDCTQKEPTYRFL